MARTDRPLSWLTLDVELLRYNADGKITNPRCEIDQSDGNGLRKLND
jgi:hypothetical protein